MSLQASYQNALDSIFVQKVAMACAVAACNVQTEPAATPNHTNRANYAKLVLGNLQSYTQAFAFTVCAIDGTLTGASLDSVVQTAVNTAFNALAGTL